jgi:hypothetical protein
MVEEALEGTLESCLDDWNDFALARAASSLSVVLQKAGLKLSSQRLFTRQQQLQTLPLGFL